MSPLPPCPPTPCREWQGPTNAAGYGLRSAQRRFSTALVHRQIMAMAHGEESIKELCVIHLCDNPPCYRYDHLRIGTLTDNNHDAMRKGRTPSGERHHANKLTDSQWKQIARRHEAGESQKSLSKEFGIDQAQISRRWRKTL